MNSLKDLWHKFPFLNKISIDANLSNPEDPGMIQYGAKNLVRNHDSPQPKTHTVSLIATNSIGVSKASFLIRVFGKRVLFKFYLNK